ncbi:Mpo1-like protein [uncultured Amphritea sp.]|uniref:Mpo1-like protein n=1 Tax=uncultured Amphritea sp. TaxID=981605 RepID=UPI00262FB17E|nr:Mpo1-like protein [uncultured Amphritea sp.]
MAVGLFIPAWLFQFISHNIEGRKPSFFRDIQFLLIVPMWLMSALYRRLGVDV